LAEAGFDVLVVEEGSWYEQGKVVPFSLDQMERQYRSGGVTVALGLPSVAYTEGRCAGGGTEVNSGLYRRPPPEVIERWADQWKIADLDYDDVACLAVEVERDINVTALPGPPTMASQLLAKGAERLDWSCDESPRWMKYPEGTVASGRRQSMTETYLPRAHRAGARILTDCRIQKLNMAGDTAVSVNAELNGHRQHLITFQHVFVCAGAIQSPALLQRSGLHRNIGRSLAVHPTVKLSARFDETINVPDDVPVHQVKEFAPDLSFGGSASHPGLIALSLLDQWSDFKSVLPEWRNIAIYYAAITSQGRGRVVSVPGLRDPLVTYHLTARDRHLLKSGLGRLSLLMLEAGAREVFASFRSAPVIRNRRDVAEGMHRFRATKASVMTVHLCSTVPMGEDLDRCGADSFGRIHGTNNVFVNDASLLPDAPGVNPQGTVMAIALRNARHFAEVTSARG
jgi:choline dehydrogenase-like flavoprotein